MQEFALKTRSMKEDTYRLRALARHPIAKLHMSALTPIKVDEFCDERLKMVSNGAVILDLSYFSSIINHARRELCINMVNPILLVKELANPQGRPPLGHTQLGLNDDE